MTESDRKKILALRALYGFGTIKLESEKEIPSDITLTDDEIQSGKSLAKILEERRKAFRAAQEKGRRERLLYGG